MSLSYMCAHNVILFLTNLFIKGDEIECIFKICGKEPQSLSHCDSFDHPDLQSFTNRKFFFDLQTEVLGIWGLVIYH